MALFKILKGNSNNLGDSNSNNSKLTHEGYAYFVLDTGKLYIDIDSNQSPIQSDVNTPAVISGANRIALNAATADYAKQNISAITKGDTNGYLKYTKNQNNSQVEIYTHPNYTAQASGFYKVTVDALGHVSAVDNVVKSNITALLGLTPTANTGTVTKVEAGSGLKIGTDGTSFSTSGIINHSNSVTAVTAFSLLKVKYDTEGHITSSTAVTASDITDALGYTPTTNTGTVTSITPGAGLVNGASSSTSQSAITTSGTISIGAGAVANTMLANSSISIAGQSVSLGGSLTATTLKSALSLGSAAYTDSTDYATSGHTHSYIPLSGSNAITGNLQINTKARGYFLTDRTGNQYAALYDNGSSLWIGSTNQLVTTRVHAGCVFINAGWDEDESTGNTTIYICVPASVTGGGTNYAVAHSGNVGTGDSNGQVKIAYTNVSVKGLAALAYKDSVAWSEITSRPANAGSVTRPVYWTSNAASQCNFDISTYANGTQQWGIRYYGTIGGSGSAYNSSTVDTALIMQDTGLFLYKWDSAGSNDTLWSFTKDSDGKIQGDITGSSGSCRGNAATATTLLYKRSDFTKGTIPSSTVYYLGNFSVDSTGTGASAPSSARLGGIEGRVIASTGDNEMRLIVYKNASASTDTNTFAVGFKKDGTAYASVGSTLSIAGALTVNSALTQAANQIFSAGGSIEMHPSASANHGGFIDFHYNNEDTDYTERIIGYNGNITMLSKTNTSMSLQIKSPRSSGYAELRADNEGGNLKLINSDNTIYYEADVNSGNFRIYSYNDCSAATGLACLLWNRLEGSLTLRGGNNSNYATTISTEENKGILNYQDTTGTQRFRIYSNKTTDGTYRTYIMTGNTTNGYNQISIGIKTDGTRIYSITDPTAFRNAIGASSGAWPVSIGGTGTTTTPTKGGVIYAYSTSAYSSTAAGTTGQYLKSNGASGPTWENMPAGTTISANTGKIYLTGYSLATKSAGLTYTLQTNTNVYISGTTGYLYAARVYNAVWNDIAEYRQTDNIEMGRVYQENDNGIMTKTQERLIPGCSIASDTFGTAMGETVEAQTPMAIAGRVLVYPYQNRDHYHAGMAVCSAPNGTVDIMTREEIMMYSDAIIGTVSEIPEYEIWGTGKIEVDGRIWVKIK